MTPSMRVAFSALLTATAFGLAVPSRAACAPPMVSIGAFRAEPGDTITVTGQGWVDGCDDTGGSAGGCAARDDEADPVADIELRLMGPKTDQTDRMLNAGHIGDTEVDVLLAEAAADGGGGFTEDITIPDVAPGRYFITGIGSVGASQPPQIDIVPADVGDTDPRGAGEPAEVDHPDGWRITVAADQKVGPILLTVDNATVSDTPDASSITHDLVFVNTSRHRIVVGDTRRSTFIGGGKPMLLAADRGCGYARLDPGAPPEAGACDSSLMEMRLGPGRSATQPVTLSWGIDGFRDLQSGAYVFNKVVEFQVGDGATRRFRVPITYSVSPQ